jgi:hypothetical protein
MDDQQNLVYDYNTAGFDKFFVRNHTGPVNQSADVTMVPPSTAIPFDRGQQSGSFGNIVRFGNVFIDGVKGRISIYDENQREVARIGELDD